MYKFNIDTKPIYNTSYGFIVPCHNGEIAWLIPMYRDTYIRKNEECWCVNGSKNNPLYKYLMEIKSGEGNWIISPQNDNSDLKWSELDYKNAKVIKRVTKTEIISIEECHE